MQPGKRAGGADEVDDEHEEAQQMHAAATDTITNVCMRALHQEVLVRLFKLRDYLVMKGDSTCVELAKNCHSTYLYVSSLFLELILHL
jgi:hypothetical protein